MIEIRTTRFDPWLELQKYTASLSIKGGYGATAVFIGSMRDFNEGDNVTAMTLEHYPGMTEKHLEKILHQAQQQWPLLDSLIIHRVGEVLPDDSIVLVAVWTAHRASAYDANRFIMEELKSNAPFWKKETLVDGTRWVEKNTPG